MKKEEPEQPRRNALMEPVFVSQRTNATSKVDQNGNKTQKDLQKTSSSCSAASPDEPVMDLASVFFPKNNLI